MKIVFSIPRKLFLKFKIDFHELELKHILAIMYLSNPEGIVLFDLKAFLPPYNPKHEKKKG